MTQSIHLVQIILIVLLSTVAAEVANAQFRLDIVKLSESPSESGSESESNEEIVVLNRAVRRIRLAGNLDNMLFGKYGNRPKMKRQLAAELLTTVDLLALDCDLTREQREKLLLAGQLDIAEYFAEAEAIQDFGNNPNQIQEALNRISKLARKLQAGLFSDGSMLDRVTKRTLTSDLNERQASGARQRKEFAFRAAVKLTLADLEQLTPLTQDQRTKLFDSFLLEPPPLVDQTKYYGFAIDMLLGQDSTEEILDANQYEILRGLHKDVLRGQQNLQNVILQNGRLRIEAF